MVSSASETVGTQANKPIAMGPPDLPPQLRAALITASLDKLPGGLSNFDRAAFLGIQGLGAPVSEIDKRWRDLYEAEIWTGVFDFLGLNGVVAGGADPRDKTFSASGNKSLGELAALAETRFDYILRLELERFRKEVDVVGATAGTRDNDGLLGRNDLQTPRNLALLWSLFMAAAFADLGMSRMDVAYTYFGLLASIFKSAGFAEPFSAQNMDDFQFGNIWNDIFWFSTVFDFWIALQTGKKPHYEPHDDSVISTVKLNVPPEWQVAFLPPPSKRPIAAPIPPLFRNNMPLITARDFFCWADPLSTVEDKDKEAARAKTLGFCVAGMKDTGTLQLGSFLVYLGYQIDVFIRWLKEEAGLTMLELLAASEVLGRSQVQKETDSRRASPPSDLDPNFERAVLKHPFLKEALRRHSFFLEALDAILTSLPSDVAEAAAANDIAGLQTALPRTPPPLILIVLGNITHVREMAMQLSSPELFTGLATHNNTNNAVETTNEPTYNELSMDIWFSSNAFAAASQNAIAISALLRTVLATIPPSQLKSDMFSVILCYSATHAAWLHLLVLQRFRTLLAQASEADLGKAEALYNDVRSDVEACIEMLKIAGSEAHQSARLLLEELFEGRETKLSRADMEMLRLARQVARRCPHGNTSSGSPTTANAEGYCWICSTTKREESQKEETDALVADLADDLAKKGFVSLASTSFTLLSPPSLQGSKFPGSSEDLSTNITSRRKVRFADKVAVGETWSADDYPARSMRAPFDPELEFPPATPQPPPSEVLSLNAIMEQRANRAIKLPDLRRFW